MIDGGECGSDCADGICSVFVFAMVKLMCVGYAESITLFITIADVGVRDWRCAHVKTGMKNYA